MTTPTNATKATKPTNKSNGTTEEPQPVATSSTKPSNGAAADDKRPVTVMIPAALHKRVKVMAELSGSSLSDLVEEQLKAVVRERLPGLLAALDADG